MQFEQAPGTTQYVPYYMQVCVLWLAQKEIFKVISLT